MAARYLVPGYEITTTISDHGGQAVVYQARQLSVARLSFAIKVYRTRIHTEGDRIGFLREVKALRELAGHHNVVRLADADIVDGMAYLVMELCKGSLADHLRDHGPLPAAQVADVARRVCNALSASHARGILHRDLKPSNLLITTFDDVVVADFGIAALGAVRDLARTREQPPPAMGTPGYLAPELLAGARPSIQSDVYALGATLHTLLHGSPPAEGQRPVDPGVPGRLAQAIDQALHRDPSRRFATIADFARMLTTEDLGLASSAGPTAGPATIVDPARLSPADDLDEGWLRGIDLSQEPSLSPAVVVRAPSRRIPLVGWWAVAVAAGLSVGLAQTTVPSLLWYVAAAAAAGAGCYALLHPRMQRLRRLSALVLTSELIALGSTAGYFAISQPRRTVPAVLAGVASGCLAVAWGCRGLNSWQVARADQQRSRLNLHWKIAQRAETAFENSGRPPSWLSRLLALPATRLYRFGSGPLEYAAACGSRVVLFAVVRWHHGQYAPLARSPHVTRNGQPYRQGAADLRAIIRELPRLAQALGPYQQNLRVLVVITRDGITGDGVVVPHDPSGNGLVFTTPETVTAQVGGYLAQDPHHIDVRLTQILLGLTDA